MYLIGAYARYNWPYVWVRAAALSPGPVAAHARRAAPTPALAAVAASVTGRLSERDGEGPPARPAHYGGLVQGWRAHPHADASAYTSRSRRRTLTPPPPPPLPLAGWHVWHIVEELLALNLSPAPLNPFEVDLAAVTALPAMQRLLMTAALAGFLRELLLGNPAYADKGAPCLQRDALPPPPPGLCRAARGSSAAHHGVTQEAAGAAAVHVDLRKLLQLHFADASRCLTAEPTAPAEAAGGGGGGGSGGGLQQYQQYQQGAAYAAAVYGAR